MAIPQGKLPTDKTSVSISYFALEELNDFLGDLHGKGMKVSAKEDLVGALILAARRSPIEATKALVQTYWEEEARIAAVTAAASFLHAHRLPPK
jgi:hypothetical protein